MTSKKARERFACLCMSWCHGLSLCLSPMGKFSDFSRCEVLRQCRGQIHTARH